MLHVKIKIIKKVEMVVKFGQNSTTQNSIDEKRFLNQNGFYQFSIYFLSSSLKFAFSFFSPNIFFQTFVYF